MSASSSSTFERKARGAVAEAETGGGDVTAETMRERGGGDVTAETMRERGGVQSLERAFAILEKVARHRDGVRLRELSKHLGLHTSTTFHLVKTMVMLGYLRQMPDDKTYRIGTPLFTLAAGALDEIELSSLSRPVLEDLSASTGENSHFAIRSRDDVVVLSRTVR